MLQNVAVNAARVGKHYVCGHIILITHGELKQVLARHYANKVDLQAYAVAGPGCMQCIQSNPIYFAEE